MLVAIVEVVVKCSSVCIMYKLHTNDRDRFHKLCLSMATRKIRLISYKMCIWLAIFVSRGTVNENFFMVIHFMYRKFKLMHQVISDTML